MTEDSIRLARSLRRDGRSDEEIENATGLTLSEVILLRAAAAVAPAAAEYGRTPRPGPNGPAHSRSA
jgi:hypothetical protein